MKTYNILIPPDRVPDGDHEETLFLVDDKAWLAILIPPVWLIWHRLWWALLVYFAVLIIMFMLLLTPFILAVPYLTALPGLYLLLEGHELIRQKYERKGWQQIATIQAATQDEAELRYFARNEPNETTRKTSVERSPGSAKKTENNMPGGLFPLDGRI